MRPHHSATVFHCQTCWLLAEGSITVRRAASVRDKGVGRPRGRPLPRWGKASGWRSSTPPPVPGTAPRWPGLGPCLWPWAWQGLMDHAEVKGGVWALGMRYFYGFFGGVNPRCRRHPFSGLHLKFLLVLCVISNLLPTEDFCAVSTTSWEKKQSICTKRVDCPRANRRVVFGSLFCLSGRSFIKGTVFRLHLCDFVLPGYCSMTGSPDGQSLSATTASSAADVVSPWGACCRWNPLVGTSLCAPAAWSDSGPVALG